MSGFGKSARAFSPRPYVGDYSMASCVAGIHASTLRRIVSLQLGMKEKLAHIAPQ
jgi:hypothetical protein